MIQDQRVKKSFTSPQPKDLPTMLHGQRSTVSLAKSSLFPDVLFLPRYFSHVSFYLNLIGLVRNAEMHPGKTACLHNGACRMLGFMNSSQLQLRQHYYQWLASPVPGQPKKGRVAGEKTVRGFRQGGVWAEETQSQWDQAKNCLLNPLGPQVWVWSDLHLFHKNIIRYSSRPFFSVDQMNESLLRAAEEVVRPGDWLLFLGDLSFGSMDDTADWLAQIDGHKATILGNHDVDRQEKVQRWRSLGFEAVADVQAWDLPEPWEMKDGLRVSSLWLTHYPLDASRIPAGVLNIHGHTHDINLGGRRLNASVEQVQYQPQPLREWVERQSLQPVWTGDTGH